MAEMKVHSDFYRKVKTQMIVSKGGNYAASEAVPGFVQMGRKMIVRGPSEQPIGMDLPTAKGAAVVS